MDYVRGIILALGNSLEVEKLTGKIWKKQGEQHPPNVAQSLIFSYTGKSRFDMTTVLKVKRLLKILSPAELAAEIGVTTMSIENWRTGKKRPIPAFERAIAKAYRERVIGNERLD